jgi:hypothetical protein
MHVYEVRPRKDKRGFDLISEALPFGGLWYLEVADAIEYAKHYIRAHAAVIRVYDETLNDAVRRQRRLGSPRSCGYHESDLEQRFAAPRRSRPTNPSYQCNPWLVLFRCYRGDDFFEARVAAQRVPERHQF